MIILIHKENTDQNKAFQDGVNIMLPKGSTLEHLKHLALEYPNEWIGWTDKERKTNQWDDFFNQNPTVYTILSKGNSPGFLNRGIDYVEDTPFINFKENQWYPTWMMSLEMGMIHSSILKEIKIDIFQGDFKYDLNLLTRILQHQGLFCYSHLIKNNSSTHSDILIYKFIAQTKKRGWILFLLLCHLIYEKRFPIFAFAKALFHKIKEIKIDILSLQKKSSIKKMNTDYDVIIPTMGRASYLKDVLKDLSSQNISPQKVIIVEQNADTDSSTDLNYLKDEEWPFEIVHKFIHQTGACNARNLGLKETDASWILFFDDDIRFENHLMNSIFKSLEQTKSFVVNLCCLQKGEVENQKTFKQWSYFGSGCSILHRNVIKECSFDMALEHGYGEDVDYGMQIRNKGFDIIYTPQIQILHLKAPVGGFRKPVTFKWDMEEVKPKPSPQIMYFRKKNFTFRQVKGYKLIQLFKRYHQSNIKNPFKFFKKFKKAWNLSESYASNL